MEHFKVITEDIKVLGKDVVALIEKLLHEGNVRRVIVRDASGHTFMEVPIALAAVGVIAAPVVAAVSALAALVADLHIVVERVEKPAPDGQPPADQQAVAPTEPGQQ